MAEKLTIDRLYAYLAESPEGEGLVGFQTPDGQWIAMVGADKARMEALRPLAQTIARESGQTIRRVCFLVREDLERILPRTYEIEGARIRCLICGRVSVNRKDVVERYCGHCHRFHEG